MLLTKAKRKKYFKLLGLGEYSEKTIKDLQKKYFTRKSEMDGKYGKHTDILLINLWRVTVYAPHFKLKEFRCECGGKYCNGYPHLLNIQELIELEALRNKVGSPLTVTSGLRCKGYNDSLKGSSPVSSHLYGEAIDVCGGKKTDTLIERKKLMSWLCKQKGHRYTYCDGWEMGTIVGSHKFSAPYMGNSIHFDVKRKTKPDKKAKKKAYDKFMKKHKGAKK